MFSNGFIMGFVMESLQRKGQDALFMLKGLTPHGIFELPALFIAGAAGLRIGFSYITTDRKKQAHNASQSIREAAATEVLIVIPLLFLAAFIEAYISAALIK